MAPHTQHTHIQNNKRNIFNYSKLFKFGTNTKGKHTHTIQLQSILRASLKCSFNETK